MSIKNVTASQWWTNLHYAFLGYIIPVVLVFSTLQNGFTLVALLRMNKSMSYTTRVLFMALAVADLFNLLIHYGLEGFADFGLHYLTNGAFYFRIVNESDVVCKPLRGLGYFWLHCSHWLYVLVNADRLLAVLTPHHAHRYRSKLCIVLMGGPLIALGLIITVFSYLVYEVKPSAAAGGALVGNDDLNFIYND